jgi:hypothetical protein
LRLRALEKSSKRGAMKARIKHVGGLFPLLSRAHPLAERNAIQSTRRHANHWRLFMLCLRISCFKHQLRRARALLYAIVVLDKQVHVLESCLFKDKTRPLFVMCAFQRFFL